MRIMRHFELDFSSSDSILLRVLLCFVTLLAFQTAVISRPETLSLLLFFSCSDVVFLILSLLIIFKNGRPIFFLLDRIEYQNKRFTIYKFRSINKASDTKEARYATELKENITKEEKLMRPVWLDEILQFINILKRILSFIGPRPEESKFADELTSKIPYYNYQPPLKTCLSR